MKYLVNINEISDTLSIPISLNEPFGVSVDNSISLEKSKFGFVNPLLDYEKTFFIPIGVQSITIEFKDINGDTLVFSDFGFTNDDLFYLKNNFINSFLSLNLYDSDVFTNQRLVSNTKIQLQLGQAQRDSNGDLLDVSINPVSIIIDSPIVGQSAAKYNQGYFIYYYKTLYGFPLSLYSSYTLLNAKTGKAHDFTLSPATTIEDKLNFTHLQHDLYKINNAHYYTTLPTITLYEY